MLSIGFGYRRNDFRVRISYSPMIKFYNMFNISVSYSFGETRAEKNREKVENLITEALGYFSKGNYEKVLIKVSEVLDLDPKNDRAKRLYEIIEKQIEIEEKLEEIQKKVNG